MTDLLTPLEKEPDFKACWKRWKGPVEGRLANTNEGKHEAEKQWNKLSGAHKRLVHIWGPTFQRDFRRANNPDCTMMHLATFIHKKRFLNYEDDQPPGDSVVIKQGEPGWYEWLAHDPTLKTFGGKIVVPTHLPGDEK